VVTTSDRALASGSQDVRNIRPEPDLGSPSATRRSSTDGADGRPAHRPLSQLRRCSERRTHMLDRRRRLAARFLAIGLLAAMLFTADSLSLPSPAEARCTGVGNPVRSTFSYGGGVAVSETPVSGTCNGNQLYTEVIKDERADGYCVFIEFMEAGGGCERTPVVGPRVMRVRGGGWSRPWRSRLGSGSRGRCGAGGCCTRSASPRPVLGPPAGY
jgi:hypothetical protein